MTYPSIVIGGGPAGSAAAIELARAGREVCLLERKRSAHDKVCGEFISWEAAHYLQRLGIDLPAMGAQPIRHVRLYNGHAVLEDDLPFCAWSLSRRRLDARLLETAEKTGASLRRGVAVSDVVPSGESWAVGTRQGERFLTKSLFLASGKHDLRNWRRRQGSGTRDMIAFKMHLYLHASQQKILQGGVELYLFQGGYAGLEPVEQGRANLCFVINKNIYHRCDNNWSALLSHLGQSSDHLQQRLTGALSLWSRPLAVYGTPYGYLHRPAPETPGLFRLGDQMAVIPSFAGDGIAIALHSGFLAAGIYLCGGDSAHYHRQARNDFKRPVRNARIVASLFSKSLSRKIAFASLGHWPGAMAYASSRIRLSGNQLKNS